MDKLMCSSSKQRVPQNVSARTKLIMNRAEPWKEDAADNVNMVLKNHITQNPDNHELPVMHPSSTAKHVNEVQLVLNESVEEANNQDDRAKMKRRPKRSKVNNNSIVQYSSSSDEDFSPCNSDDDPLFCPSSEEGLENISDFSDYEPVQENPFNKIKTSRWRQKNTASWKVNNTKELRSKCLPYTNKRKACTAKSPKPVDCSSCRFKCSTNFSQEDRIEICLTYWSFNDYKRQKDFLVKNVVPALPKRRRNPESLKTKLVSKSYFLDGKFGRHRVCAKFFETTLCISNGPINTALRDISSAGCFIGKDQRGRKKPGNKTNDESVARVKEHIESFPCVESHYVRKTSKRRYLDPNLSILKMYELYKITLSENDKPVSEWKYRQIFCRDYNLSFFIPKKDQCATCSKYNIADSKQKQNMELEYSMHVISKNECNEAKERDKQHSAVDPTFVTATFDLQSVLQLPYSAVSQFYYSRKICVYNLTIYEGDGTNAYCYCWNELNGKRGSNEVGSILLKYIETLPPTVHRISLFSDTCGGQNRNQQVAAALLYAVQNFHFDTIEQKFLESGHSYMECDSMHSAIETSKKHKCAYIMNDWLEIFKSARSRRGKCKNDQYKVTELKFNDFLDLHGMAATLIKNRTVDDDGQKVNWLKIKCLKFEKTSPGKILFRYDHSSLYKTLSVLGRGRPRTQASIEPKRIYKQLLPIAIQKKNDLIKLCKNQLIPQELHHWYENLPTTSSKEVERLSEPNFDEDSDSIE